MGAARVLLADDHPLLRESVAAHIADHCAGDLKVVAQAADGSAAVEAVKHHDPDLVLMDIHMPGMNGIDAIREIRRLKPRILLLVFSALEDQANVLEAIQAGADDYIFKRDANAAAVAAHLLRAVDKEPQQASRKKLFEVLRGVRSAEEPGVLTGAEIEVLKMVAHHGCSMKEAAQRLGGTRGLAESTIRKHLERIYQKLGARSQSHAVCLAIKRKILSPDGALAEGEKRVDVSPPPTL